MQPANFQLSRPRSRLQPLSRSRSSSDGLTNGNRALRAFRQLDNCGHDPIPRCAASAASNRSRFVDDRGIRHLFLTVDDLVTE